MVIYCLMLAVFCFKGITESQSYDENIVIKKECVDHETNISIPANTRNLNFIY